MNGESAVVQTSLPLPLFIRGKVRDIYELGEHLLIVATDRISVFDVILPDGIPDKGRMLNQISAFWFRKTSGIVPNHLLEVIYDPKKLDDYLPKSARFKYPDYLRGRSMVVRRAERINIEWVIRGYISGSAWEEYQKSGTIQGLPALEGLQESQQLPEPIFTPTTKAESGHDKPLSLDEVEDLIGRETTDRMKEKSLAVYLSASEYARERGLIIADTKMEFGRADGELMLIDELLTPDSSRFWGIDRYKVGQSQPSYDKQPVRDWTAATGWNKQPPGPRLSPEVIEATARRYREACEKLTGRELA